MTKTFCDACGTDQVSGGHKVKVACHLMEGDPFKGYVTKIGSEIVSVSGRMEEIDLCPLCYNLVMGSAVEKFKELKEVPR